MPTPKVPKSSAFTPNITIGKNVTKNLLEMKTPIRRGKDFLPMDECLLEKLRPVTADLSNPGIGVAHVGAIESYRPTRGLLPMDECLLESSGSATLSSVPKLGLREEIGQGLNTNDRLNGHAKLIDVMDSNYGPTAKTSKLHNAEVVDFC